MKPTFLTLLCLMGWLGISAQNNLNTYHAISGRVMAIDHNIPNEAIEDAATTFGFELGYRRQFGKYLGLFVPIKVGVSDFNGFENPTFGAIDGILQLYPLGTDKRVSPYLQAGFGFVGEPDENSHSVVPAGLGFNFRLGDNSWLSLQGEYRSASLDNRDNVQASLGYIYRVSSVDTDGDGIVNRDDRCPEEAGPAGTNGCPDQDSDGIIDSEDACPFEAGTINNAGCPDTDGDGLIDEQDKCPEVAGPLETKGCPDRDEDGVLDEDDACPDKPGSPDHAGCPDSDNDGRYDNEDDCPFEPAPTSDGCPITDRDGDGFNDVDDECPYVAGPLNGCPDKDGDNISDKDDRCPNEAGPASNEGCPEVAEEVQEKLDYAAQAVEFQTGSAELKQSSYVILAEIAGILRQYPNYDLVISGHTDNVGSDQTNLLLSQRRAASCLDFLVATGIRSRRLSSTGYGESRPKADNGTREGRSLNRRVEFDLRLR